MTQSFASKNRRLSLVDSVSLELEDLDLSRTLLIGVQHLCSSTYALFKALEGHGLAPENTYLIGKCYSTNPRIVNFFEDDGFNISKFSNSFDKNTPYDLYFENVILDNLDSIIKKSNLNKFEKIILLDDGGHLIKVFSNLNLNKIHNKIIGIEQTSSGLHIIDKKNIKFPIINVARSALKLNLETPLIVDLATKTIKNKIDKYKKNKVSKILILGMGTIGQSLKKNLEKEYEVFGFDINQKNKFIRSEEELHQKMHVFDLVVGCTGKTSIDSSRYKYLKSPVILASVSSSDREFDSYNFRAGYKHKISNSFEDITIDNITLCNCGFPITFDNDFDSIDTDEFQLTRAILFISIYQAATENNQKDQVIELSSILQDMIREKIKQK